MSRIRCPEWDTLSGSALRRKLRPGIDAQNGTHFPFEPLAESVSRNSAPEWDALSDWSFKRKVHPGIRIWNGTHFPEQPSTGNCVPEFGFKPGHAFRTGLQPETASHSESSFWDTLSARSFVRKAHPVPSSYSGTHFPVVIHLETASQFERLFRDTVSAERFNRKVCPVLGLDSGTRFPLGPPSGMYIPF